jgi:hypothetical protein
MKHCLHETTLFAWIDGELPAGTAVEVQLHLAACAECAARERAARQTMALLDDALQADFPATVPTDRLRARIDAGLRAEPASAPLFGRGIAFLRWQFAAGVIVLVIAVIGALATRLRPVEPAPSHETARMASPAAEVKPAASPVSTKAVAVVSEKDPKPGVALADVRSTRARPEAAPAGRTTQRSWGGAETSEHLGQTQLLLRSVRNAEPGFSNLDYERDLARELLSRNRLLRRRAEQKEDLRTEELLSHIEPLLLDISNLPGRPAPGDMQTLQQLIREQQIIAELQLYVGKSGF